MLRTLALSCALVVALCACQRPPEPCAVTLLPAGEVLYKVDEENGFESVNFGLVIAAARPPRVDSATIELSAAGINQTTVTLSGATLASHARPGRSGPGRIQYEDFHLLLSRGQDLDQLSITLRRGRATITNLAVPLRRYQQQNRFRLPVEGCWFVSSGHDFGQEHRRWYTRSHFGWDLVKLDHANGLDPGKTALEQFPAFGQPVLAPAAGRVFLADDQFPDKQPGVVGRVGEANYIIIDHGRGELSKLAHLRQGSLRVKTGDQVAVGQALAEVGNSGMSDAPHLHLHFQRNELDESGVVARELPLPALLQGYTATSNLGVGRVVERGRPRRGEFVCAD